jgi:O-antigen ligase
MSSIVGERFEGTSADPASNIDARLILYRLAWHQFADSPFVGTGWTALRAPSEAIFGGPISFAHNWYLSALQIAGLLAVPMLIVFTVLVFRSIRGAGLYGAPVAAAFVASMIEPVMEGYVGALVIGTILLSVYRSQQSRAAAREVSGAAASVRGGSGAQTLSDRV